MCETSTAPAQPQPTPPPQARPRQPTATTSTVSSREPSATPSPAQQAPVASNAQTEKSSFRSAPKPLRWWRRKAVLVSSAVLVTAAVIAAVVGVTMSDGLPTLPFTGLKNPAGVAVDGAGNVYVADTGNDRVLMLAAGSRKQTRSLFDGPDDVAVDDAGNVYVTDGGIWGVVKLTAGTSTQSVLPFSGRFFRQF